MSGYEIPWKGADYFMATTNAHIDSRDIYEREFQQ